MGMDRHRNEETGAWTGTRRMAWAGHGQGHGQDNDRGMDMDKHTDRTIPKSVPVRVSVPAPVAATTLYPTPVYPTAVYQVRNEPKVAQKPTAKQSNKNQNTPNPRLVPSKRGLGAF